MRDWLGIFGEQYADAVFWTLVALVALVVVLLVVRLVRKVGSGAFSASGRDRRPRLGVTDSLAVDNQRRLVLVRRDDVEHLILIGGPGDVVVEQDIRPNVTRPRVPQPEPAMDAVAPAAVSSAPVPPPVTVRREPILPAEAPRHDAPEARNMSNSSAALERQNGPSPERTMAAQQGHSASQPPSRHHADANGPVVPAVQSSHQETGQAASTERAQYLADSSADPRRQPERAAVGDAHSHSHEPRQAGTPEQTQSSAAPGSRSEIDDEMSKLFGDVSDEKR